MRRRKGKRQIGPVRLIVFIGSLLLLGYHILSTPGCREKIVPSAMLASAPAWISDLLDKGGQADAAKRPVAHAAELEVFAEAFSRRDPRECTLPQPHDSLLPLLPPPPPTNKAWSPRIDRIRNLAPGYEAQIGGVWCHVGGRVTSRKSDNCDYIIVAVNEKCVWMKAVERGGDEEKPRADVSVLPKTVHIRRRTKQDGVGESPYVVLLAGGSAKGDKEEIALGNAVLRVVAVAKACAQFELTEKGRPPIGVVCGLVNR